MLLELKSLKNNLFIFLLSFSNSVNYISYIPFILLYLFEKENISIMIYIELYIFFIAYDLVRSLSVNIIRKISNFIGINKLISINLIILIIINFGLFFFLFEFRYKFNNKYFLCIIIIFRIMFSLTNISSLFKSEIISNLFEKKEFIKKTKLLDLFEKLNNILIFIFMFLFIHSLSVLYLYFFCSTIYNIFFTFLFIIYFKCYDERKNFVLYEEKNKEKKSQKTSELNSKNKKKKMKLIKRIKNKEGYQLGEDAIFSKSNDKGPFENRKSSSTKIINDNRNLEKENNENNNENGDIDNNMIILTTNNNQVTNNDNNIDYQKQNINIINNIPISSSQRVINEKINRINSLVEDKNIIFKKKWIFITLILVPSKFLKSHYLFMLLTKSYSLKKMLSINFHFLFYCGYFLMSLIKNFLNKIYYSKLMRITSAKKILIIIFFIISLPACFGYIYINLNDLFIHSIKLNLILYALFFILSFILREVLIVVLQIFYINSKSIGFNELMLKNMKSISNILGNITFLVYYSCLLFLKRRENHIIDYILYYFSNYFLPLLFLILFFVNTIKIS